MASSLRLRVVCALGVTLVPLAAGAPGCTQEAAAPPLVMSVDPPNTGGGSSGGDASTGSPVGTDGGLTGTGGATLLASGVHSPQSLALAADTIYWTTAMGAGGGSVGDAAAGTGSIESVPRAGGVASNVVSGLASPSRVVFSGTTLYFDDGSSGSGVLEAYTLGSALITTVATGQSPPLPMVAYEGSLYWANGNGTKLDLETVLLLGGTARVIATEATPFTPLAIVNQGTTLYVLATLGQDAYVLRALGGAVTELWHGANLTPVDLAISGETLYFTITNAESTMFTGGEILSLSTNGGTPKALVTGLANPAKLAVDANNLYVTTFDASGAVLAVTLGGSVSTLASGQDYPYAIAVDGLDDSVYFATASTVAKVAK